MLEAKPETIELFDEIGKLHFIGIRILKGIFNKRGQCKNHADSGSSPLFESCTLNGHDENFSSFLAELKEDNFNEQFGKSINFKIEEEFTDKNLYELKVIEGVYEDKHRKMRNAIDEALTITNDVSRGESSNYLKVRVFLDVQQTNISQVSKRIGVDRKYIRRFHQEGQEFLKQKIND